MKVSITKREFMAGGLTFTVGSFLPYGSKPAFAAAEDDRIVAAAKPLGATDLRGMIWSNYYVPMQPAMQEFKQLTGIGVGSIQDISIFDAPQRAMAEALSRSPQFDFFHIDSNMIPSLASAGLLEPLDEYMKKADFKIDAVGDYASFMTYAEHLRHYHRRQRPHPVSAQGPDGGRRQPEAVRGQARQEAGVPADLGGRIADPAVLPQSGQGHHRLRQPAQSRQRRDLVVHDVLLRRRLPVRRRHESDAEQRSRQLRGRDSICRKRKSRIRNRPAGARRR